MAQHNRVTALLMGLYQERNSETFYGQIKTAAISELEPLCQEVYFRIAGLPFALFAAGEIAKDCNITPKHAATVLKQLYDLGLLARQARKSEAGKHYFAYWAQ